MAEPILIGAQGWDRPAWTGTFYPEALPADWRFSFYCNHLRAVLVPAATWSTAPPADVRGWAEDVFPEFRFVVELSATSPAPFPALDPIRSQIAGLLLRAPAAPDKAWLTARLGEFAGLFPLCVDLPPAARTPELLACLTQHNAGLCWRADAEPEPRPGGKLMVALAASAAPSARGERSIGNGRMAAGMSDITLGARPLSPKEPSPRESAAAPRAQRRWLEQLASWQGEDGQAALFFENPEPATQARLLAELMVV